MKGWAQDRENKTLTIDSPELLKHLENGGNYGVLADKDRFIIATDTKEIEQAVEKNLPKTFSVRSPRHKTKHFYYYGEIKNPIQCKPTSKGDPCADIRIGNSYVLGPGCQFKDYGKYEIVDDHPIERITEEQLTSALDTFILPKTKEMPEIESTTTHLELSFPITDLKEINIDAMSQTGKELVGPHPQHGSTTGSNFNINLEKNCWHCFRAGHESGGGPLELLAVLEGIIKCEESKKGILRNEKFKQVLEAAKKRKHLEKIPDWKVSDNQFVKLKTDSKGNQKTSIDIEEVLNFLFQKYIFKTSTDTEDIYIYNKGIYQQGEILVKTELEELLGANLTTHYTIEILNHIRRKTYTPRSEFNKSRTEIPVLNGILNLTKLEVTPFSPEKIFTYKINATYDESADCPKFKNFLEQILLKEERDCLQEYCGYCLFPAMPFHKMLWMYGAGRNGKGRIILTMTKLLGQDNASNVGLEDLNTERRFAVANLYGMLMNVASEPGTVKSLKTPLLKKVTGEDWLDGEVKNKQHPIRFQNVAKFFILGNKFAKVDDTSQAFWDRCLLLYFPYSFTEENQNLVLNIEKHWINNQTEMSGILNWLILGLDRLMDKEKFTRSHKMEELQQEFRKISDVIGAFINEECIIEGEKEVTRGELYGEYKIYAEELGTNIETERIFVNRIRQIPRVSEKKIGNARAWKGLGLKEEPDNQEKL